MEIEELRNYGQVNTAKLTPQALMVAFTSIPKELGIIGTPRFAAKLASTERRMSKKEFKTAQERGLTHEGFLQGMRYGLSFYSALVATEGREKARKYYPRLAEKIGVAQWEEFLPTAEDFLSFSDPWDTLRIYWRNYFAAYEREGGMRYEIVVDTENEFRVKVTECAWDFIWREGGYPELAPMSGYTEVLYIPKLMAKINGGDFTRDSCLCSGESYCDWHFHRRKA